MSADWPEHGKSGDKAERAATFVAGLIIFAMVAAYLVGLFMIGHGAITRDIWEVVQGGALVLLMGAITGFIKWLAS